MSPIVTHHFLGKEPSGTDHSRCDNMPHGRRILYCTKIGRKARRDETENRVDQEEKSNPRCGSGREQRRKTGNQSQPCFLQASSTRAVSPCIKRVVGIEGGKANRVHTELMIYSIYGILCKKHETDSD